MKTPVRVGLFGAGNVGLHLLRRMHQAEGVEVTGLWNRHPERWGEWQARYPVVRRPEDMPPADVYILALKDDVLGDFSARLKDRNILTVHTSGAQPSAVLQTPRKGVFYPLQTFVHNREVDWSRVPLLVYAPDDRDEKLLQDLARRLSPLVYKVDDAQRARLHVAAVFASNYTNAMWQMARDLLAGENLDTEILKPLLEKTFAHLLEADPREMLTGPARRGDRHTIRRHLDLLRRSGRQDLARIYEEIARWILARYGHGNEL